jgi:hypothetical protein
VLTATALADLLAWLDEGADSGGERFLEMRRRYTTRNVMTGYYQNLKHGMGRAESLCEVQLEMLKRNPKMHPFYWANFIESGDWTPLAR